MFQRSYEYIAKLGLVMKDDPVRVVDPAERKWGNSVEGLALSVEAVHLPEDVTLVSSLSVTIRNVSSESKQLLASDWLHFYQVHIDGAEMSAFGVALLKSTRQGLPREIVLEAGALSETQIPIASIFELRRGDDYSAHVSCAISGLESNRIRFTA